MTVTIATRGVDHAPDHRESARREQPIRRGRAPCQARRALKLASAALALATLATPAEAVDTDSPGFLPALVAELRKKPDMPNEGLQIGGPFVDRAAVTSGGSDYSFTEYLTWQQLRFTFDLRIVRKQEDVLKAMRALRESLKLACGDLAIQHKPLGTRATQIYLSQPYDTFMSDVYRRLFDEGLIGSFECLTKRPEVSPRISVTWETGDRRPTEVIPAHEWRFLVEFIGRDEARAHQERFEQHRRGVDALRAKPSVGAEVQVMVDDLPSSSLTQFKQPLNRLRLPYAVCGLVTEVRAPLAQVQIQSSTLMIPIRKLLPAGHQLSVDEMARQIDVRAPTQRACLR